MVPLVVFLYIYTTHQQSAPKQKVCYNCIDICYGVCYEGVMRYILIMFVLLIGYLLGTFTHELDMRRTIRSKGYIKFIFLDFTVYGNRN